MLRIKGLANLLSHDCHFDIDRDVSTAHCRSSSGNNVDLLIRTICTTVVVSDQEPRSSLVGFDPKHCCKVLQQCFGSKPTQNPPRRPAVCCRNVAINIKVTIVRPQAAQAHYVWARASEVIWSDYTRIISVLSDAK